MGTKKDLEGERTVSALEIKQFCDSMQCIYLEISVFNNIGIEDLVHSVIENCIILEKDLAALTIRSVQQNKIKTEATDTKGSSTGNVSLVPDVQPLNLKKAKKKQGGCC